MSRRSCGRRGRILVVGRNSFLARHFLDALAAGRGARRRPRGDRAAGPPRRHRLRDHLRPPSAARPRAATGSRRWTPTCASRAGSAGATIAYLMLSSRKVYAPSAQPLAESLADRARRPLRARQARRRAALRELLGERLTVLRLANVFGYERGAGPPHLPLAVARPPRARGPDPLRHEPVRRARLPAGRGVRAAARTGRRRRRPAASSTSAPASACRPGVWRSGSSRATAAASW